MLANENLYRLISSLDEDGYFDGLFTEVFCLLMRVEVDVYPVFIPRVEAVFDDVGLALDRDRGFEFEKVTSDRTSRTRDSAARSARVFAAVDSATYFAVVIAVTCNGDCNCLTSCGPVSV